VLLERASVLLQQQSPNPNEASGAGVSVHNESTRLMVVPHLRTKTRVVHPPTLCVWEKNTFIPPTCHNGNGSEHAFVGRSDPHLDRTSVCVSQTVCNSCSSKHHWAGTFFFSFICIETNVVRFGIETATASSTNGQRKWVDACALHWRVLPLQFRQAVT